MINWKGIGGALAVTLVGLGLIGAYVSNREQTLRAATETKKVLVFTKDLPAHHMVGDNDLGIKEIPKGLVLEGGFVSAREVAGRELAIPVLAGEQVIGAKLMLAGETSLRNRLPKGYRAIAVEVNNGAQLSGELKIGDYVDIILAESAWGEAKGRTLLDNVQVIGIKTPDTGESWQTDGLNLILAVRPPEAEKLAVAGDAGKLYVALRNQNEIQPVSVIPRRAPKQTTGAAGQVMIFRGLEGEAVKP